MTRKDFIGKSGRWLILSALTATGGFLVLSGRISLRDCCAAGSDCAACGLNRVCHPHDPAKTNADEKK